MTEKPVAQRERFIAWHTRRYGYPPLLDREGIPHDEFPEAGAERWEIWQAALAQQPAAKPGEDAGLAIDTVLEAFKRYMDLSDRASFTLERKVWLRFEDAINDLATFRAAQRTATERSDDVG